MMNKYFHNSYEREFSASPIREIIDSKTNRIVFVCTLPKAEGDKLSEKIVDILNS